MERIKKAALPVGIATLMLGVILSLSNIIYATEKERISKIEDTCKSVTRQVNNNCVEIAILKEAVKILRDDMKDIKRSSEAQVKISGKILDRLESDAKERRIIHGQGN